MIKVGIGATTEVDRHNCKIPKEVLEKMVDDINRGTYAVGVGMEHDLTILPIGKIVKSELISLENGEHAAIMYAGIFEKFVPLIGPGGTTLYFAENKKDARPFADTKHENIDVLTIGIDPVNFDEDKFIEVQEYLQKDCELQVQTVMRKSSIPDPEVMIYLISGSLITLVGGKSVRQGFGYDRGSDSKQNKSCNIQNKFII